jgi:hypothetical protein
MRRAVTLGLRCGQCLLAIGFVSVAVLGAQDRRDSLITRAKEQFDPAQRTRLLIAALDPTNGPPQGAWGEGIQLLAQTLIDDGRDSVAAVWLRWAVRLSPSLQPDTVEFPPPVTSALQAARQFVSQTSSATDGATATSWVWPVAGNDGGPSRIQVDAAGGIPIRSSVDGDVALGPGGAAQVAPGSHGVSVAAAGYDSVRVTREVLPGTTTVLRFRLQAAPPRVAAGQPAAPPPQPAAAWAHHKRFPWVLAALGVAGAGTAVAVLAGGSKPPTTGGITISFPNP